MFLKRWFSGWKKLKEENSPPERRRGEVEFFPQRTGCDLLIKIKAWDELKVQDPCDAADDGWHTVGGFSLINASRHYVAIDFTIQPEYRYKLLPFCRTILCYHSSLLENIDRIQFSWTQERSDLIKVRGELREHHNWTEESPIVIPHQIARDVIKQTDYYKLLVCLFGGTRWVVLKCLIVSMEGKKMNGEFTLHSKMIWEHPPY